MIVCIINHLLITHTVCVFHVCGVRAVCLLIYIKMEIADSRARDERKKLVEIAKQATDRARKAEKALASTEHRAKKAEAERDHLQKQVFLLFIVVADWWSLFVHSSIRYYSTLSAVNRPLL